MNYFQAISSISSLAVFIGLYIILLLVFKILSWSSPEAQLIGKRLKTLMWGFIVSLTAWWFFLDIHETTLPQIQASIVRILWCFIIFFFFMLTLDVFNFIFFDIYYAKVKSVKVPQIISNLLRVVYFVIILLIIFSIVLGYDIKPLLTGSAILTAIIGLALQDTLSNLFSGLTLHMSRPFEIGHWIRIEEIEGLVVKIEWRDTTIKTREEDYVHIPNSHLSKVDFINYSTPTTIHGVYLEVGVGYEYPPNLIKKLLSKSAIMTPGVVREIPPDVFLVKYNDFSIDYRMRFFVNSYQLINFIRTAVMERVWYTFQRNNVVIPFPIRDVYMHYPERKVDYSKMLEMMKKIDFLQDLKQEELEDAAKRMRVFLYSEGEEIIRQGDMGETFFIIKSGTVRVISRNNKGEVFLSKELEEGNFFGEISVLTGDPRTASVIALTDVELFTLDKNDFDYLLSKYPHLTEKISKKIALRQKFSIEQMELSQSAESENEARIRAQKKIDSLSDQILNKIKSFFTRKETKS